jgi:glucokinase
VAIEVLRIAGDWLGRGLVTLALTLDPGCFVIGGGVSEAGELLLAPARAAFEARLPAAENRPLARIVQAQLGNDAGLVGAADLARA